MRNKEDKWPHLSCLMFNEHIGIMAVGETHLTEAQIEEIEDAAVGRKRLRIFNSIDPDHPNKGGVAVVLNRDITNTENIKVRRLIPGRAILVTIPWHDKLTLTVLAVYAPAGSAAENRAFWEELHRLWMTENLPVPDVMLGDMNIVEDAVDRLPHRTDDADATHALADLKRILELKDGWRMTYPDTKEYIFSRGTGSHSRIDRIYVSPTSGNTVLSYPPILWPFPPCIANIGPGPPFVLERPSIQAWPSWHCIPHSHSPHPTPPLPLPRTEFPLAASTWLVSVTGRRRSGNTSR
ncbi:hypothetical protein B0H16DRAFT_1897364 [Mycena metata]|uniref:Endonuclease/exonuclease/phosphatase domain-containing protein n=1 Tax=Mycena metata TaxID=1033252 RepID=A0AAD7HEQ7_9AGAR|nr:hypothetical protein B0H16DRAFT_1897364 [Mycena metata]